MLGNFCAAGFSIFLLIANSASSFNLNRTTPTTRAFAPTVSLGNPNKGKIAIYESNDSSGLTIPVIASAEAMNTSVTVEFQQTSNTGNVGYTVTHGQSGGVSQTRPVTAGATTDFQFRIATNSNKQNIGTVNYRFIITNVTGSTVTPPNVREDSIVVQRQNAEEGGGCSGCGFDFCIGTGGNFDPNCPSPILVDTQGNGFNLTDASHGVSFDINGDGASEVLAWTVAGSDDAWLAFDRNHSGTIDNGAELFGNYSPQPESSGRNGFLSLAEYDKAIYGGNEDGIIDGRDAMFSSLRLWKDLDHDGRSDEGELFTLPSLGVNAFDLDYKEKKHRDEHGNWFRYRSKVYDARGQQLGRWAWDVFLTVAR
ncbi:MAG TPA: hypothetical protein VNH22_14860 [Blastocatellia bacterium]|jgi:hypothetical protein|nr:hypothetical protein [Blastocatellia bacterium]